MQHAITGLEELKPNVDTLIVIPNERLFSIADRDMQLVHLENLIKVLHKAGEGIAEIIAVPGNVDFADVRTVMENKGTALMGIGMASGENRDYEKNPFQIIEVSLMVQQYIVNIFWSRSPFEIEGCIN